jgi:hypothetical protein
MPAAAALSENSAPASIAPGKGRVGEVDVDVEAVEPRLAQVEGDAVGIVGPLLQFGVEIPLAGPIGWSLPTLP